MTSPPFCPKTTETLEFHEARFLRQLDRGMMTVRRLVDSSRHPTEGGNHALSSSLSSLSSSLSSSPPFPQSQSQSQPPLNYEEKYAVAEGIVRSAIVCTLRVLARMGIDETRVCELARVVRVEGREVTLRLESRQTCEHVGARAVSTVPVQRHLVHRVVEESKNTRNPTTRVSTRHIMSTLSVTTTTTANGNSNHSHNHNHKHNGTTIPLWETEGIPGEYDLPMHHKNGFKKSSSFSSPPTAVVTEHSWKLTEKYVLFVVSGGLASSSSPQSQQQRQEQQQQEAPHQQQQQPPQSQTQTQTNNNPHAPQPHGLLLRREGGCTVTTTGDPPVSPVETATHRAPVELGLRWLLEHISCSSSSSSSEEDENGDVRSPSPLFSIDRCTARTPRRNPEVEDALQFFGSLHKACRSIHGVLAELDDLDLMTSRMATGPGPRSPETSTSTSPSPSSHLNNNNNNNKVYATRIRSIDERGLFIPVLPLLFTDINQNNNHNNKDNNNHHNQHGVPHLSSSDFEKLLDEQSRTLDTRSAEVNKMYAAAHSGKIVTVAEAMLSLYVVHMASVAVHCHDAIHSIEHDLTKTLRDTVGSAFASSIPVSGGPNHDDSRLLQTYLQSSVFRQRFLQSRHPKHCVLRHFRYPVRGKLDDPSLSHDGVLSIELSSSSSSSSSLEREPILTISRRVDEHGTTTFPIDALTTITTYGPQYIHGWFHHRFGPSSQSRRQQQQQQQQQPLLVAKTRNFSSGFLLVVGGVTGGVRQADTPTATTTSYGTNDTTFHPRDAMFLRNGDELTVPLQMEEICSHSLSTRNLANANSTLLQGLSPTQQRFAETVRSLHREEMLSSGSSLLLGICVIPVKPQLEAVLNLPDGSLTREIRLVQQLVDLFMSYGVPPDLLSFEEVNDADTATATTTATNHNSWTENSHTAQILNTQNIQQRVEAVRRHVRDVQSMIDDSMESSFLPSERPLTDPGPAAAVSVTGTVPPNGHAPRPLTPPLVPVPTVTFGSDASSPLEDVRHRRDMFREHQSTPAIAYVASKDDRISSSRSKSVSNLKSSSKQTTTAPLTKSRSDRTVTTDNLNHNNARTEQQSPKISTTVPPSSSVGVTEEWMRWMELNDNNDGGLWTTLPRRLDAAIQAEEGTTTGTPSLSPTVVRPSADLPWRLARGGKGTKGKPFFFRKGEANVIVDVHRESERNQAFGLLDALTRGGSLPLHHTELHVLVAATQTFESSRGTGGASKGRSVETMVISDNDDPLYQLERSAVVMANVVDGGHNDDVRSHARMNGEA